MKFSDLKATLAAAALLGSISAANAGLISGAHTTIGGKDVALQGYEWMSLDHTAGLSRETIENVNGFTDRYGTTWDAGDWVYASRTQTEVLMNSLWGGTYDGWATESVDGTKWFLENFGELKGDTWTGTTRTDGVKTDVFGGDFQSSFFFGNDGECSVDTARTCIGIARYFAEVDEVWGAWNVKTKTREPSNVAGGPVALTDGMYGYDTGSTTTNWAVWKNARVRNVEGSLLIRAVDVPEPSTLAIFALGLMGLASRRLKKQS